MARRRSFWRGFLCVCIGIVTGIVLTLGGVTLTGYLMLKNTKLKKINSLTGTEIVGQTTVNGQEINLANMSVLQLFKQAETLKNSTSQMTISNVEELFPALNLSGVLPAKYLTADKSGLKISLAAGAEYQIPLADLRSKTFKQAAEHIAAEVKAQTTFSLLGSLGFNFNDFPFVAGTDGKNPVYTYVALGKNGYGAWYAARTGAIYYMANGNYLPATAAMLNGGAGDGVTDLYYKAQGLVDMPVVDGVNAMIAELSGDKLTIARLDEMLALGLKDENGEYGHIIIELLAEKKLTEIENSFNEISDTLKISDLFTINPGDVLYEMQYLRYTEQTAAEHNAKPENVAKQVIPGDYVLDAQGNKTEATINSFVKSIEYAKVKDLIQVGNSKLLSAIGNRTLKELSKDGSGIANNLTLDEVMDIPVSETALTAIKYLRFTPESAAAFNEKHALSGANAKKAGDKVPVLAEGETYNPATAYTYAMCTLKDLATNVNNVPLGEILGVTAGSEKMLQALKDTTLSGVNAKITSLKLSDVIQIETDPSHTNYSKILYSLKDSTVSGLGSAVNDLALQDVVDITESSSLVLKTLATVKISNLPARMDTLKVKEVIVIDSSSTKVLRALADKKVNEIGTALDTMPISDMVDYAPTATDLFDRLMVDLADKNATLSDMGDKINHVKISALFNVNTDTSDAAPDGVWYFLLKGVDEEQQTLENLENMINVCAENISSSTIRKLNEEGVLDLPAETPENEELFDMKLNDLLVSLSNNWNAVSGILGALGG